MNLLQGLQKEMDIDGVLLGEYVYDQSGKPLQSFNVQVRSRFIYGGVSKIMVGYFEMSD